MNAHQRRKEIRRKHYLFGLGAECIAVCRIRDLDGNKIDGPIRCKVHKHDSAPGSYVMVVFEPFAGRKTPRECTALVSMRHLQRVDSKDGTGAGIWWKRLATKEPRHD